MVKIWARVHFPVKETHHPSDSCHTMAATCCCDAESYATDISDASRFQWNFQTRQTRKKDRGSVRKIGHENPMNSGGPLSDTAPEGERMVQKDWAEFSSAVYRVARSGNQLDDTNNKKVYLYF